MSAGELTAPLAVGQISKTALCPGQAFPALLFGLGEELVADWAIEHRIGMGRVSEEEGQIDRAKLRYEVDKGTVGDDGRIHDAHLHALEESSLIAQDRVRENCHLDFTIGVLFRQLLKLGRREMKGILLVHHVGELDIQGKDRSR